MREVLRTSDAVELCWARAVLDAAGIDVLVFDHNIAAAEGAILAFPQRLMVASDMWPQACAALDAARAALRTSNDP
ncbi:MAG: DUF2007 domain-containing protein [Phreatobacter sp.]|uniref:putative signal transducing protein n=1 Tax=Phreatobacter sp. TaxID=1966341 RepID=UPI001A3B3D81|nr:DUF2007 domain-containing protein [Phreatobacter sp.]MBL8567984.1 DUF2007 domain-containing protein [Phreatobacter sp.]